jgi:hypothetical protein
MTIDTTPHINKATAIGTLDVQRQRGKERTPTNRWNSLQGREDQIALQVCSPYGAPFRLQMHLEGPVPGLELIADSPPGTPLAVEGELEWELVTDPRYALGPTERGRQSSAHFPRGASGTQPRMMNQAVAYGCMERC